MTQPGKSIDALLMSIVTQAEDIRKNEAQVQALELKAASIQDSLSKAQSASDELTTKHKALEAKLEGFYQKQIEVLGLFVAIFSFIIAGIQVAVKSEGWFVEKLATSAAVFIPITLCICVLLGMIRWTTRR